ncbi:hypothetical protein M5689_002616 [Euphorbia peplus]|nr:hypothetical protein M5689_002616 [Euphorbia peplus]
MFQWRSIKVQAMVDKEKKNVVFAECDADFGDVLFSFLTIPMGTLVSLPDKDNLPTRIGCMNNLYTSVKNLDLKYFRTHMCLNMLLHPRNAAAVQCRRLKITTEDYFNTHRYFTCGQGECLKFSPRMLSHYSGVAMHDCGSYMYREQLQLATKRNLSSDQEFSQDGVFLRGLTRLVITDDLKLIDTSTSASFSLLSDLGVMDATVSALELREFHIGYDEVLNLLKSSLASKEPLTHTLLHKNESDQGNLRNGRSCSSLERKFPLGEAEKGKIDVKLFISKSKKIVCFAEVCEDFVDLVFSFLTLPLRHVLKQLQGAVSNIDGCVDNLYKSVEDLDVEYFKSGEGKEVLLNPKLPPKFGYDNQLIGIEEVSISDLYVDDVSADTTYFRDVPTDITVIDPKIPINKEYKSNGGFMEGPAMFTVTDNLTVIPISPGSGLNILNNLEVPLSDLQERVVHVGSNEAMRLLVASFVSGSALTDTFMKK